MKRVLKTNDSLKWVVISAIAIAAPAATTSAQAAPLTITKSASQKQQAAALAQWTRAKIAAAPAMASPVDNGLGAIDATALEEAAFTGPAGTAPPGSADPSAIDIAQAAYSEDWAALAEEVALEEGLPEDVPADILAGTAGVFTSYDVNTQAALWQIYPHRWDGKLTFTTASGGASCSATVIRGNNIVTAAHCVYDTSANRFHTGWAFTPAFRNGSAPFGTFPWRSCTVLNSWINLSGAFSINTWSRHDVAVCTMGNNSAGQTLNGAVGFAGRLWNAGNSQLVFNSGYPARTYTDALISNGPAQYLRSCTAETFLQATETLGSGCNWGRGISGGSWLVNYKPFIVSGNVNSVNSGLFFNQQNLYGARFNSNNIVPLCNTRGC